MKTKISYALSCILMFGFFVAKAQTNDAQARTTKIIIEMTRVCSLNDDQQTKMKAIILERETQRDADMSQYEGNAEALKTAAKARNAKAKQEASTVLSQTQIDQWKAHQQQKKDAINAKREQMLDNSKSNQ